MKRAIIFVCLLGPFCAAAWAQDTSSGQASAPAASRTAPLAAIAASATPLPAGTLDVTTAGGTVNKLAKFDTSTDITFSQIFDNGTNVGIGNTSPAGKLDVSGGAFIRGVLLLPPIGAANALAGSNSQPVDLLASSFNSTIATAVNQHFRWQAEPVGNKTTSPSGKLNLLFAPGAAVPAETGLSLSATGGVSGTTATFSGNVTGKQLVSTIANGTAPLVVTSKTQVTNLNATLLGGLASTAFAKLAGGNTITGNQSITGNLSATGSITGGSVSGNGAGLTSVNAALLNGFAAGAFAFIGSPNTFTGAQTINNNLTVTGNTTLTGSI